MTSVFRYCVRAGIAAVLSISCIGQAVANSVGNLICFTHIGVQEKPMPEFCIGTTSADKGEHETVLVSFTTAARVLALCERLREFGPPADAGSYRWATYGQLIREGVVGPKVMLQVAKVILADAKDNGRPRPEILVRLTKRLGG